jgi:signal transduction histidine kinase
MVAAAAAIPIVAIFLLARDAHWSGELVHSSQLIANALVLGAAVIVYFHWRVRSSTPGREPAARRAGWLTVGLTVAGLQGVVQASLLEATVGRRDSSSLAGEIAVLLVLIVLARVAERTELPGEPAVVGVMGAIALGAITTLARSFGPPLVVSASIERLLITIVMAMGLLLAWTLLRRTTVSMWARQRLASSVVLLTTAHCLGYLGARDEVAITVAVLGNLGGASVLCTMTQALLRRSVLEHQQELQQLQQTLAQVRADVLEDRELLHEVGSTVAGITTAARVISQAPRLSPQRRERLEHMLDAELARLDRLMSARAPSTAYEFEVDEVIELLVISHQERGLDVHWSPGHLRALGDPDDLAEVVNILLENARRHGGTAAWIDVSPVEGYVQVVCTDDGPGVADQIRPQLFSSGARGPDSPGQGLGLSIAQRLLSERGGSLALSDSRSGGATFVARLPMSEAAHVSSHNVA